jgi:hypothetical protein
MNQSRFLDNLRELLASKEDEVIFPCIADLVLNGIELARFTLSDRVPNRQDVTQYLAAWFRHANISEEACRNWLSDFAVVVLLPLSRSSPSQIRHSTKSNVKYIYGRMVPFICELEKNRFRAQCNSSCRVYEEMANKTQEERAEALDVTRPKSPVASPLDSVPILKQDLYREQFRTATQLVRAELARGTKKQAILDFLMQKGLKTRTGREWSYSTLNAEIRKLGKASEHQTPNDSC